MEGMNDISRSSLARESLARLFASSANNVTGLSIGEVFKLNDRASCITRLTVVVLDRNIEIM